MPLSVCLKWSLLKGNFIFASAFTSVFLMVWARINYYKKCYFRNCHSNDCSVLKYWSINDDRTEIKELIFGHNRYWRNIEITTENHYKKKSLWLNVRNKLNKYSSHFSTQVVDHFSFAHRLSLVCWWNFWCAWILFNF